jgi:sterol desaturase/sphingolipid hydroxylase (fatty acid hydroxylase superfamily)
MSREQIFIAVTLPVYFVFMVYEYYKGHSTGIKYYDKRDTLLSLWFGIAGASLDIAFKGLCFLVLDWFNQFAIFSQDTLFQYPLLAWVLLFLAQDFAFYWLHRSEHSSRLFWAVHSNHHSSTHYNFAVALRSSVFQPVYRFLFYIPVALMGFDALSIMFIYALNQSYQFFLHTQLVGNLGWPEKIFVTPSHHRVHHASNLNYLDRNMGQVLIIWDKMFGTFQQELPEEKPVFGLTKPLQTSHPFKSMLHEFFVIWKDVKQAESLPIALKYLFWPPGWRHDGKSQTARELREQLKLNQQLKPVNMNEKLKSQATVSPFQD